MTPLHLAAKMGFKNLVQNLISQHGALLDAMTLVGKYECKKTITTTLIN